MAQQLTIRERLNRAEGRLITDKIEDTFGPNPCTSLVLHLEDGTSFGSPCNRKRCRDCGPRKKAIMWEQTLNQLGDIAYVTRLKPGESHEPLTRGLERAKKDKQRKGIATAYTIVGDDTLGHLIISDRPIHPNQRRMDLREWRDRILDLYHHSVQRIRRSRIFGKMSLVHRRRKNNKGQPSPWRRRTLNTEHVRAVEDLNWGDELARLEAEQGALLWYPPDRPKLEPDLTLPIPY